MSDSLSILERDHGPLDIVLDPAPPRPVRHLPSLLWVIIYLCWAAGFVAAGGVVVSAGPVDLTDRSTFPSHWWYWLAPSGIGAIAAVFAGAAQHR